VRRIIPGIVIKSPANPVDPAEAESLVDRLSPCDRRLAGVPLLEAHKELGFSGVVIFEPFPERGR
jgi:hypothetical protein